MTIVLNIRFIFCTMTLVLVGNISMLYAVLMRLYAFFLRVLLISFAPLLLRIGRICEYIQHHFFNVIFGYIIKLRMMSLLALVFFFLPLFLLSAIMMPFVSLFSLPFVSFICLYSKDFGNTWLYDHLFCENIISRWTLSQIFGLIKPFTFQERKALKKAINGVLPLSRVLVDDCLRVDLIFDESRQPNLFWAFKSILPWSLFIERKGVMEILRESRSRIHHLLLPNSYTHDQSKIDLFMAQVGFWVQQYSLDDLFGLFVAVCLRGNRDFRQYHEFITLLIDALFNQLQNRDDPLGALIDYLCNKDGVKLSWRQNRGDSLVVFFLARRNAHMWLAPLFFLARMLIQSRQDAERVIESLFSSLNEVSDVAFSRALLYAPSPMQIAPLIEGQEPEDMAVRFGQEGKASIAQVFREEGHLALLMKLPQEKHRSAYCIDWVAQGVFHAVDALLVGFEKRDPILAGISKSDFLHEARSCVMSEEYSFFNVKALILEACLTLHEQKKQALRDFYLSAIRAPDLNRRFQARWDKLLPFSVDLKFLFQDWLDQAVCQLNYNIAHLFFRSGDYRASSRYALRRMLQCSFQRLKDRWFYCELSKRLPAHPTSVRQRFSPSKICVLFNFEGFADIVPFLTARDLSRYAMTSHRCAEGANMRPMGQLLDAYSMPAADALTP